MFSGVLTPSTENNDDGSVGLYTVSVTAEAIVRDPITNAVTSDTTATESFNWDVSRWARGDVFVGLGAPVDPDTGLATGLPACVADQNGNHKRDVSIREFDDEIVDPNTSGGGIHTVEGFTGGCAVNWHTGEVFSANYDFYAPAVSVIERHPGADGQYSHSNRRIDASLFGDVTKSPLPVDSALQAIAFNNAQTMFLGFAGGWETMAGILLDIAGNPIEFTDPVFGDEDVKRSQDAAGNVLLQLDGTPFDAYTPGDANFNYLGVIGQNGQPIPVHRNYGRDLDLYSHDSVTGWSNANRTIFSPYYGVAGVDQIDISRATARCTTRPRRTTSTCSIPSRARSCRYCLAVRCTTRIR